MNDFVVSARKYRPCNFDEIIGQDSVSLTLKNSIKNNHLGQSFLFCGPRGVGKTSCARILAKTINCSSLTSEYNPCNICKSCVSFSDATSFNIHELDAASNNGVDKIRELIDQVRFAPQIGKYNVYIIDEVHMLSTNAFNAFLKTLEEPPKHAKFILATTEKHKIIPTILSRCQIFDFKRISVEKINNHLSFISKSEGISADNKALHIIAQKAEGSLRDALSIFDRLISFSSEELNYQDVINTLRILDYDYYFRTVEALSSNNISELMLIFDEILKNGFDGHNFIIGLAEHLRDLLVCKTDETIKLIEKGIDLQKKYLLQSESIDVNFLIEGLRLCNDCDCQYKSSKNQRLLVELCLLQISSIGIIQEEYIEKSFVAGKIKEDKKKKTEILTTSDDTRKTLNSSKDSLSSRALDLEEDTDGLASSISSDYSESKTISISETLSEINNSVERKEKVSDRKGLISNEELQDYWHELVATFKQDGKINLSIALSSHQPELLDENTIQVLVDNITQEELVLEEKSGLSHFLSNKFNNDYITIKTKVLDNTDVKEVYTTKETYERMKEDNPKLEELSKKLNLDPDY